MAHVLQIKNCPFSHRRSTCCSLCSPQDHPEGIRLLSHTVTGASREFRTFLCSSSSEKDESDSILCRPHPSSSVVVSPLAGETFHQTASALSRRESFFCSHGNISRTTPVLWYCMKTHRPVHLIQPHGFSGTGAESEHFTESHLCY